MVTARGDLTDAEWHLIGGLLPPERGRPGKPASCNRTILDGILFRLRTGCPWRDLPERFGKWNTVWRRFARWRDQGLFELILDAFAGLGRGDDRVQMLDSTVVRVHQHASGGQRGLTRRRWAARAGASARRCTCVATAAACLLPSF
jgi:transposase